MLWTQPRAGAERARGRQPRRVVRVGAAIAFVGLGLAVWAFAPVQLPPPGVVFRAEPGSSFRAVARELQRRGVVRSSVALEILARLRGADRRVRAGDYQFEGTVWPKEVLQELQSVAATLRLVTVREGLPAREVVQVLAAAGLGGVDVFECVARSPELLADLDMPRTGLEGYLYPDTYAIPLGTRPEDVLRLLVHRFYSAVRRLDEERIGLGLSLHEMVTLASLIEKETGRDSERPLISAVFHNRLRIGMPLQSDPTAVYGKNRPPGPVTAEEVQSASPYNTYLRPGLPPGPICNPGLASLEAAVRPAAVDYLYFVARADGTHEFSRTYEEHRRAVARQRRARDGA